MKHSLAQDAAAQPKTAASGKTARKKPVSDRRQAVLLPPVAGGCKKAAARSKKKETAMPEPEAPAAPKQAAVSKTSRPKPALRPGES